MPWVRIDEHALNHVKLLALSHAAFRLWVEGLAHCQKHLTDGLISRAALKGFRYGGAARVAELTSSVDGASPLWTSAADGFAVHDYLQWNDDRTSVEHKRERARERMAKLRGGSREQGSERRREATPHVRGTTSTTTVVPKDPELHTHPAGASAGTNERISPLIARGAHRSHAVCGVVCVPAAAWEGMLLKLGGDEPRLSAWIHGVMQDWRGKVERKEATPDGDDFAFWRHRWAESFGSTKGRERKPEQAVREVPDADETQAYLASLRGSVAS